MDLPQKFIWLSDLHLDSLAPDGISAFLKTIRREKPDGVLLTGDISIALQLKSHLELLAKGLRCPVYFVLGNHDFYHSNFTEVDRLVGEVGATHSNLLHLGHGEVFSLGSDTALIGHRGWGDGRAGVGKKSTIRLNDSLAIDDLKIKGQDDYFRVLRKLGDESAQYFRTLAPFALSQRPHLVMLTHVPPFTDGTNYPHSQSNVGYLPYYVNVALGEAIIEVGQEHPKKRISVYCGHTHEAAEYHPLPNVTVKVAQADYSVTRIVDRIYF